MIDFTVGLDNQTRSNGKWVEVYIYTIREKCFALLENCQIEVYLVFRFKRKKVFQ